MEHNPFQNEDICESIFTEEWYEKVAEAVQYTINQLESANNRIIANKDDLAKYIVDYNIHRELNELVQKCPLPTILDWRSHTITEMSNEFKDLLETCLQKNGFTKHTFTIKYGSNKCANIVADFWKEIIRSEMKKLSVTVRKNSAKGSISVTLKIK